ncbi:restriction endonuclease subunit S [Rhizobium laguerreae]|uniref:restriction endonuclease subunit S n=1 Tax=Rhizobium laguerreae TaxID=1076926 RepID=UPI001C920698|nr:restriction endonuclease subunit S [Rhizobium laguerreae]MBY3390456.1 restriction endonuclease subunit S [Rhizobium laguerreae]MBY3404116.1 restriction endonuclease subunit S [Rhizobium laguerreae]MBY3411058.1 restriction endonuclease subunit S [Rhizobium laguerreae]
MNSDRLLEQYEKIAEAPEAISRLRSFILDLAVRGKLLSQDARDEKASELLKRVAKEKARLMKAGEIRAPKALPEIALPPFDLPLNWSWTQLAEIGILSPRNTADDDQHASFVPMPLIAAEYGVANGHDIRPWKDIKKGYTHFAEGDVGLAKITPCFENGKSTVFRGLMGGIGSGTTELHVVRPVFVQPDYILLFLKSPHFIETGIPRMTGTAGQKRVPTEYFAHSPFPLPPLPEQHRIVAKVDELMALCDQLEAARTAREATRDRLAAASLARLNSPDPETFADDAHFVLDALPALTARPDQIKQLRQTILNLAVRGKLVPQDPGEEPAEELLKRITRKRTARLKAGTIPKPKVTSRDVTRFSEGLPIHWSPIALGDVCDLVTSGSRGWAEYYADSGPGFVRAQNIRFGRMRLDDLAFVRPPSNSEGGRTQVSKYDLLIVITGAGVTNPALLERDLGEAYVSQHVGLVRPSDPQLSPWLLLCLMADAGGRSELVQRAYGAGKPGLNLDNIRSLSVPLPPLAEQHRIVAKVDDLMALCDQLEASLTIANEIRRKLLDALLAEALAPVNAKDLQEAAE